MTTVREIKTYFQDRSNPPVIAVSDAAGLLNVDDAVVRRWCRQHDCHRVGPNFCLTPDDVAQLAADLEDEDLEDDLEEDDDEDDLDDEEEEDDDNDDDSLDGEEEEGDEDE